MERYTDLTPAESEFPSETMNRSILVSIARFATSLVVGLSLFSQLVVATDDPWKHPHSPCIHSPTHSHCPHVPSQPDCVPGLTHQFHNNVTLPGGHSICEPYIPDFSMNDFSTDFEVWNGDRTYGSNVKVTSRQTKSGSGGPKRIRKDSSRPKWIKNPFYKESAKRANEQAQ